MAKKLSAMLILSVFLTAIGTISSCKKENSKNNEPPIATEMELYSMAQKTLNYTWYKNTDTLLDKSQGSGHLYPYLRTRYNSQALQSLDSNQMVKPGATFAEGSVIVKELFNGSKYLQRYAILYKKPGHVDADANGWVWGYINYNGAVAEPAANKGSACSGCHSQTGNIDYTLMNKYFP